MRLQISTAVGPLDFLEEIWVKDVVDHVWEIRRMRRLKAALCQAAAHDGMAKVLEP
jgi:hypothetical protein